jgi:hypothetical protein
MLINPVLQSRGPKPHRFRCDATMAIDPLIDKILQTKINNTAVHNFSYFYTHQFNSYSNRIKIVFILETFTCTLIGILEESWNRSGIIFLSEA